MRFCEPLGLVAVAAFAERAISEGNRVVVVSPDDVHVSNYLSRMRLGTVLAALGVEHDLPIVREHDAGLALFELTSFDGARGAGALAAIVHQAVEVYDPDAANVLYDGLCEAGQNVPHHSGRKRGFLAAQRTNEGSRLLFAVSDSGRGMLSTLRTRGAVTDADAVRLALEPRVSRMRDRSRGVGLPDLLDEITALDGNLHVISGRASVTARGNQRWYSHGTRSFPGTVVQGLIQPTHPVL
jgi:hypothetical protein